jgi:hypothetical protein
MFAPEADAVGKACRDQFASQLSNRGEQIAMVAATVSSFERLIGIS